jgi:adenylosuccinate lyase
VLLPNCCAWLHLCNCFPFVLFAAAQVLPAMDSVIAEVARLAGEYADVPMLCRTHGQTATPSTMGKEMAVFAYRLQRQRNQVGLGVGGRGWGC